VEKRSAEPNAAKAPVDRNVIVSGAMSAVANPTAIAISRRCAAGLAVAKPTANAIAPMIRSTTITAASKSEWVGSRRMPLSCAFGDLGCGQSQPVEDAGSVVVSRLGEDVPRLTAAP
jgi:hypothetical protein